MKKLFLSAVIIAGSMVSFAQTNAAAPAKRSNSAPSLKQAQEGKATAQPALRTATPAKSAAHTTKSAMPTQKAK